MSSEGGYIWIHAASLGEFEEGRPLIEMIRRNHPDA
ncbi:glycosyltransferase N-terminal domain-containing protein, partial [uncultured Muribaculum sp.]